MNSVYCCSCSILQYIPKPAHLSQKRALFFFQFKSFKTDTHTAKNGNQMLKPFAKTHWSLKKTFFFKFELSLNLLQKKPL